MTFFSSANKTSGQFILVLHFSPVELKEGTIMDDQSSNLIERLALISIANFLLLGATNPSPAPWFEKSVLRLCACWNCPRSFCWKLCCSSFPIAMFGRPADEPSDWLLFLKPPISRKNFCCWPVLSKVAVLHCPKAYNKEQLSVINNIQWKSKFATSYYYDWFKKGLTFLGCDSLSISLWRASLRSWNETVCHITLCNATDGIQVGLLHP